MGNMRKYVRENKKSNCEFISRRYCKNIRRNRSRFRWSLKLNDSDLTDASALILARKVIDEVQEYEYFEFNDGHKIQSVKTKTGKTIYVYGGKTND